ncbi:MAG: OmpA family protein [Betaproteobacteria bacterium]|nr:OmpA family protein [Betaproteobacteria bacterium]
MRTTFIPRHAGLVAALAAALCLPSLAIGQVALQGKPSASQIIQALQAPQGAKPKTRGLSLGNSEGPAPEPVEKTTMRAVDLEIPFEFNSARLSEDGKEILVQLGQALTSDSLSGVKSIVLEGHTDAKGNAGYNRVLSLRRAQTVKDFLAQKQSVPASKLKAVGKGSTELADPKNPEDGVNRRVRVIVDG